MPLTPADVERMTFSTALRGYDLNEVDDFLDQVVIAIKDLQDELYEAKSKISELERSGGTSSGPDEAAVGRVLVTAQQAADSLLAEATAEAARLVEEANQEASKLLDDARSEADEFVTQRDQRKAEAEAEMRELTSLVAGVRTELARLATSVADKLDEMDGVITQAETAGEEGDEEPAVEEGEPGDIEDADDEDEDRESPIISLGGVDEEASSESGGGDDLPADEADTMIDTVLAVDSMAEAGGEDGEADDDSESEESDHTVG